MRWEHGRRSENVEDRRHLRVGRKGLAGGGIGVIILALVAMVFGVDPSVVLNQAGTLAPTQEERPATSSPEEERLKEFMSVVLADTEDVWGTLFQNSGRRWCCSRARWSRRAASPRRRWGRSTVRPTASSTST